MSSSVVLRQEPDYRVIYLRETDFERRMADVYIEKQTREGAPFLNDMMVELIDIEAILFLDMARENPARYGLNDGEINALQHRIAYQDDFETAYNLINERAERDFLQLFQRDVYRYLMDNQISFYTQDGFYKNREESVLKNPPIIEVW